MQAYPFIGSADCAIDALGKLTLPGFVRYALERRDTRVIYMGRHDSDPCLISYDGLFARALVEDCRRRQVAEETSEPATHHARVRRTFGFVAELVVDGRGKVALPALLRRVADTRHSALVIGLGSTFEIWNPALALQSEDENLRELADFHFNRAQAA